MENVESAGMVSRESIGKVDIAGGAVGGLNKGTSALDNGTTEVGLLNTNSSEGNGASATLGDETSSAQAIATTEAKSASDETASARRYAGDVSVPENSLKFAPDDGDQSGRSDGVSDDVAPSRRDYIRPSSNADIQAAAAAGSAGSFISNPNRPESSRGGEITSAPQSRSLAAAVASATDDNSLGRRESGGPEAGLNPSRRLSSGAESSGAAADTTAVLSATLSAASPSSSTLGSNAEVGVETLPRRDGEIPRSSNASGGIGGSASTRHGSSLILNPPSETATGAPAADGGGGGSGGSGDWTVEGVAQELPSSRPNAATSSSSGAGGGGGSSNGRLGGVSFAWDQTSGDGESSGGVAGPAEPVAPPPRLSGVSQNASFSSENSGFGRRTSVPYTVASVDNSSSSGGGGGGSVTLASAMVSGFSTAPPPQPPPLLPQMLAPLGSLTDVSSYGTSDRFAAPSYSSSADIRRQSRDGAAAAATVASPMTAAPTVANPASPLTQLPPNINCGILGLAERSKMQQRAVSAPAGDARNVSGGKASGAAAPMPPPPPRSVRPPQTAPPHLMPTHVQPKGPLDECTSQAASQHVRTVWSTSNVCGIRSLPNALSPDFRDRLYDKLVQVTHQDRTFQAPSHKAQLSYGLEGGVLGMPLSVGQKQVARISPLAGCFTQFEYLPSEYDRMKLTGKYERLKHKLSQTSPNEFVVRAPPSALHAAPAFSEFTYTTDPVDSYSASMHADTDLARSKVAAGPFYPSGRVQSTKVLKGRLDECMLRLCKQLSDDWPRSFLQVFEDRSGSVVASFSQSDAVQEGDLSSYMNSLVKRHHVVATYQLTKDATRWGLLDEGSGAVFYVLWPPWVRHRYLGPHTAPPASDLSNGRPGTRTSNSSDEDEEEGGAMLGIVDDSMAGGQVLEFGDGGHGALSGYGSPLPSEAFGAGGMLRRTGLF